MKRKQIITTILCSLLLVSCGSGSTAQKDESSPPDSEESTTVAAPAVPVRDFGGKTFTFLTRYNTDGWDWNVEDIMSDGENGEPVNDAVYRRNSAIEDRYNCKIAEVRTGTASGDGGLKKSVAANDGAYDTAVMSARDLFALGLEGLLIDLKTLPDIDLTQSYWNPELCDQLSLGGKLWYAMGDLSASDNRSVRCLYFNKDLIEKYSLGDPYSLVKSGDWTVDKFLEMVQTGLVDLNGDGKYTDEDQWGLFVQPSIGSNLFYASGKKFVSKDSNDLLVSELGTGNALDVMSSIAEKVTKAKDSMNISYEYQTMIPLFAEGHSLFYSEVSLFIERFRQYDFEVGMLPMPKFDSEQENYCQYTDGFCLNLAAIPIDCQTVNDTALLIEAMSAESVDTLTKAYYDICLTGKSIRDEESAEMLDIIFGNYVIDYADLAASDRMEGLGSALAGEKEVASTVAKVSTNLQKKLDSINESLSD